VKGISRDVMAEIEISENEEYCGAGCGFLRNIVGGPAWECVLYNRILTVSCIRGHKIDRCLACVVNFEGAAK